MSRRPLLLVAGLLACLAAPAAAQQQRECDLIRSGRIQRNETTGITTFHDPFTVRCTDGTELRANRGVLNQLTGEYVVTGDVFFRDPEQELTADNATYSSAIGRLYATGDVVFTNRTEGSTIEGPELEYFRATAERPEAQITARQRPHLVLRPRDASSEAEPLELDADQVVIYGQDQLNAVGSVVILRSDLRATAWEARYSEAAGTLELERDARIESDQYSLAGQRVRARLQEGVIQHVHAERDALLAGSDLTVSAPEVQLFFADSLLQRAVARADTAAGTPRAVATSRNFEIRADSLDAAIPGQRLEQVVAIGRARGEAVDTAAAAPPVPDSLAAAGDAAAPDSAARAALAMVDRDWIVGDTLIGDFAQADSAALEGEGADTAVVLKRIVARGNAQSLYRAEAQDTTATDRRGVNFLSGDVIELNFEEGELALAEVTGLRRGLYLEPVPAPAQPQAEGSPAEGEPVPDATAAPTGREGGG